ncbi:hypothetical protein BMS3Bbin04_01130 [bacterium BMS3Bbin04]|nr:hypothetical protein BMS3Bbin04_01130 [bacterium BMS3Bbin04]
MKRALLLSIALLLLGGCFKIPRETLEIVRYTFRPTELASPSDTSYDGALLVMPFTASVVQHGDRIVYKGNDQEMATYYYHRWIAPPELLLADLLAESLLEANIFSGGIYTMTSGIAPSHELQGRLVHLYADNRRGEQAAVVEIVLSIFSLDPTTYEKVLVLQKPYRYRVKREDGKIDSFIPAVTEAMELWLSDVRVDLVTMLAEQ